jgi:hypothetical protein
MMSLGWFDSLSNANEYFTNERLVTTAWDDLTDDAKKEVAVKMAYNRIYYSPKYDVPTYAAATAAQLVILKKVNGEMAYYLAQHLDDEDRRQGLRSQGVIKAGIVEEAYKDDVELPVPPFIDALLRAEGFGAEKAFGMVDIARDEDESVDEKVDDF